MSDTPKTGRCEGSLEAPNRFSARASQLHMAIRPDTLSGTEAMLESAQRFLEQNRSAIEEIARARAVPYWVSAMTDLSASPRMSGILETQIRLLGSSKLLQSPVLDLMDATNRSIGRLLEAPDIARLNNMLEQAALPMREWDEQLQAIRGSIAESFSLDLFLQSHLAAMSRLSALSQMAVSQLAWADVGNVLDLSISSRGVLQGSLMDFTRSYRELYGSWEAQPSYLLSLPPVASRLPTIEIFNGVGVAGSITTGPHQDAELEETIWQAEVEIGDETEGRLETLLVGLDTELLVMLHGARQSLDSDNPDHTRHFATSLRELFTHVLHRLAPDPEIRKWSSAPEHYDKGNPTRKARLLYICRAVDQPPFSDFIEKDIDAAIEFLQLFQRGTHEVMPRYTDAQLRTMLVRMESLLRFVLEIDGMTR